MIVTAYFQNEGYFILDFNFESYKREDTMFIISSKNMLQKAQHAGCRASL